MSLHDLRRTSSERSPKIMKTAKHMLTTLHTEKANIKGFVPPDPIEQRRQLKGTFKVSFRSSADMFRDTMSLIAKSNPTLTKKTNQREDLDRRTLERRREQRILKNQLKIKNNL